MSKIRLPWNLIVVDLETTGKPDNRVLEIGAVRVTEDLDLAERFSLLVDGRPCTDGARAVHGIQDSELEGQLHFPHAALKFESWCSQWEYVLGSWSDFDQVTLREEYGRYDLHYGHPGHMLDVKSVVWWDALQRGFYPRKLTVDRALSIYGIPFEGQRHRALPDALMEARLFQFVGRQGIILERTHV